jgi:hypothetical protein
MRLLLVLMAYLMEESIFVDEGLHGVNGDEDEPLLPTTSSPEPVPASTLGVEASQATTSSTVAVEASWVVTPTFCKNKTFRANRSTYKIIVLVKNFQKNKSCIGRIAWHGILYFSKILEKPRRI